MNNPIQGLVYLNVNFNRKRKTYYIKFGTPFQEINVYDNELTNEDIEINKKNPDFFINKLFSNKKTTYEDEAWDCSADDIDKILSFKGEFVFSGKSSIELYERSLNDIKEQIAIVNNIQEDNFEDKRSNITGKSIFLVRTKDMYSKDKEYYKKIKPELIKEFFYLNSQKTAASQLSSIVKNNKLIDENWDCIDKISFSYIF